jgi:hypothetical protein
MTFEEPQAPRRLGPTLDDLGGCISGILNDLDELETALTTVLAPAGQETLPPDGLPVDPPAVDTAWRLCLAVSDVQSRISDIRSRLRL